VVWVLRDFCESVTESDEFVGRFREVSRLPQYLPLLSEAVVEEPPHERTIDVARTYLITAMLTGAVVLARYTVVSDMVLTVVSVPSMLNDRNCSAGRVVKEEHLQ